MQRSPKATIMAIVGSVMLAAPSLPAGAAGAGPVVVELFTSQGCSSCPPANANLIELSQRDDVLALSFAVTYWDRLGWKDTFGRPEYTDRQRIYEPALGEPGPYTPQMVINGRTTAVGNRLSEVERLIDSAVPLAGPKLALDGEALKVAAGAVSGPAADIWLVHYDPTEVAVPVARGENTGRTLPHTHVVHALKRLGAWSGQPLSLDLPGAPAGLSTAVLVQMPKGGPILSAISN